jgi:hypothetical protein
LSHFAKQNQPIVSTYGGIQIDVSDEQAKNAKSLRVEALESSSKVTTERSPHSENQLLDMISIDEGMQMDLSEKQD